MNIPVLSTKLHIPLARLKVVQRTHLFESLYEGERQKLTLISAPAGYGKTTLVSEWLADCKRPTAWLSLDEGDNDPMRFLLHLNAALQRITGFHGESTMKALQSPQPLPISYILTSILNEIVHISDHFILVLDDYHVIEEQSVHQVLSFMFEHQPQQMRIIILTREEPHMPIARLRAQNQLVELRGDDLRFNRREATAFFNQVMGFNLSTDEIASLESRTEGWIVGLQLAGISMQRHSNVSQFISSFTGSHRFVLDYLMEEVLKQQSEQVQKFLLHTSIFDRICCSLCDSLWQDGTGQETLEYLERSNLFIVPLDNERRWYRYHHLFAELLRQRFYYAKRDNPDEITSLHEKASKWFEENDLEIEAFQHAAASQDVERAANLAEGKGMPLQLRGAFTPVLNWLKKQDVSTLDKRPALWLTYATALMMVGQLNGVEQKLAAAEKALQKRSPEEIDHDLIGHIALIRATMAVSQRQADTIISQSHIALEHLHPKNLPLRTATIWTLGVAHQFQGNRAAAVQAHTEALSSSKAIGHLIVTLMATLCLGQIQQSDNELHLALQTYREVIQIAGKPPLPYACDAYLGMAQIFYEWNDLESAEQYVQQSIQLAKQIENTDRVANSELFAAKLKLTRQNIEEAQALFTKLRHEIQESAFEHLLPELYLSELQVAIQQGSISEAVKLEQTSELPIVQARVLLIQGNTTAALAILGAFYEKAKAKKWKDEELKLLILQAVTFYVRGNKERALQRLENALIIAEKSGFVRLYVDEGKPMLGLLMEAVARKIKPDYTSRLLAHMQDEPTLRDFSNVHKTIPFEPLIESLSERELEVLQLIAQGLSNQEICDRLFLALSTVKGYNRNIFEKLSVKRRTEAIIRARELGLI